MSHMFPSDDWIEAFKNQVNSSEAYKESAASWEAGSVCLVVKANPSRGLNEDRHILLDLHRGECREARSVEAEQAIEAKFTISANFDKWKKIFRGELDPVTAMMMGQISIKGDLGTLMKYAQAAKDLIRCGAKVPTAFPDES